MAEVASTGATIRRGVLPIAGLERANVDDIEAPAQPIDGALKARGSALVQTGMIFMLWVKDGPSSQRSRRHPSVAPSRDHWWAVLDGHANGGVTKYASVAEVVEEARLMVPSSYLEFAVTPWRHDMNYHDAPPVDAIDLATA